MSETVNPTRETTSTMITTGADVVLRALVDQGVEVVFGYPGGAVLPLYDALFKRNDIRHILVRHEQAAVHAAEGYARSTGKVGVVLVTSGPGATNTVTGLTDALMDSVPVVCLTGQVPTSMIGNDAFQEADTVGITRPCTKHNYLVKESDQLARVMHEAFHVARSGRPGPVVVDLPKDILIGAADYKAPDEVRPRATVRTTTPDPRRIEEAVELMARAERPVFYVGGGVINAGDEACADLVALVRETGFPITLTLMGLGAYPASDPQFLQMLGMHGSVEANRAMHDCDVMIGIGARFDDRVTGRLDGFSPNSKKIHADVDASSINKNVLVDVPLVGDAGAVIKALAACWREKGCTAEPEKLAPWWRQIEAWRALNGFAFRQEEGHDAVIKPQYAIQRLYELTKGRETFISTEVGQHQMWAAQHFKFERPMRWLTSGGLGTMGYGYPSAMGVQVAHPDALVIDIAGDASWVMNMQELSTLMQFDLPVKAFILNNSWMGMVKQWQELFHGDRRSQSYVDSQPDFVKLAEAFGAVGLRATKRGEVDDVIRAMIDTRRPVIVDMVVDPAENVYPMIPAGAAHNEIHLAPEAGFSGAISETGMVLV
ncbi:biosynthetic-type acetolactate synthase large subunit [Marinivivus vitaminiproducens]|uniref:biosynthetic-type acetolactate synthase large subunit n=1 Tax=Marinivivus vitaminiproducens TaxID=3035935 RepID=UPI00279EFB10|nr:biosynthetic-type acetolactate synthase large subunit [Geminicoccaceae bacterium SCSIO 64248]